MQTAGQANSLEEQLWRDVETLAEAPDLLLRQLLLSSDHFGNYAARTEDV